MRNVKDNQNRWPSRGLAVTVLIVILAVAGMAQPPGATGDPYYIVLCTDVSGSMNEHDPVYRNQEGKLTTFRDDAQFTFLELLRELPTETYVGVCKFTDRVIDALPGGASAQVEANNALLRWQEVGSDWHALREKISTRRSSSGGTRLENALAWAHQRITSARAYHRAKGHGIIVLLSDGDPDRVGTRSRDEVVLDAAQKLSSDNISIYPIIINKASYRPGKQTGTLTTKDVQAEQLMDRVGNRTHGRTYRITSTVNLLDIFLDILTVMPTPAPIPDTRSFAVSKHHRTVVFIGPALQTVAITPTWASPPQTLHGLLLINGRDEETGIERRIIPLAKWNIIVLHRPPDIDRIERFWSGTWQPVTGQSGYGGRIYLITDFLVQLAADPISPAWVDESMRLGARLVERPREIAERAGTTPPLLSEDLSFSFSMSRAKHASPLKLTPGQWDAARKTRWTQPFQVDTPGIYTVKVGCVDRWHGQSVSLGSFSANLPVESVPVSLVLHKAGSGEIVFPKQGGVSSEVAACRGGEKLYAALQMSERSAQTKIREGQLHLDNGPVQTLPFHWDKERFVTDVFQLPKGDTHLAGHVQAKLETQGRLRALRFPSQGFDFPFNPAPLQVACEFSDKRKALWWGEYHQQMLRLSVFPVFDESSKTIAGLFPSHLAQATISFFSEPDQDPTTVPLRCTLEGLTKEKYQGNAYRLVGLYRLQCDEAIPPSRRCEIDLGTVLTGLRSAKGVYNVVDPAAQGVFAYNMYQTSALGSKRGGVADTVYTSEPITFEANWTSEQDVNQVTFSVYDLDSRDAKPVAQIALPLGPAKTESQIRQAIGALKDGKKYGVQISTTLMPPGAQKPLTLRIKGGAFKAQKRLLELAELSVEAGQGEDVSCYAIETIELPLQARFMGYVADNPQHRQRIVDFKNSCRLTVTPENGTAQDISKAIEWTVARSATTGDAVQAYWLKGLARYIPQRTGRHTVRFSGEVEVQDSDQKLHSVHEASCRLAVKRPRFFVNVKEASPQVSTALFDSEKLVSGGEAASPVENAYATQLHVHVDFSETVSSLSDAVLRIGVALKRRYAQQAQGERIFYKEVVFDPNHGAYDLSIGDPPLQEKGDYFLHVFALDAGPETPTPELTTPTLVSIIGQAEPCEVVPPGGFLTQGVRQWPFVYHIPIQPSWSFLPIDLRFEFQFAGMKDVWLKGAVSVDPEGKYLIARGPDVLPVLEGVSSGPMQFRLRYLDMDRVTWASRSVVQVVAPRLEDAQVILKQNKTEQVLTGSSIRPPFDLRLKPQFRQAPELADWWSMKDTKAWFVRLADYDSQATGSLSDIVHQLVDWETSNHGNSSSRVHMQVLQTQPDIQEGVEVLHEPYQRCRIWGWPRFRADEVRYAVLVSTAYEENALKLAGQQAGASAQSRVITEWTTPRMIRVERPASIPVIWWVFVSLLCGWGLAHLVKWCWIPAPEDLGLSIRLLSQGSVIDPHGANPLTASLKEQIPWTREVQIVAASLRTRFSGMGGILSRGLALLKVFLSRFLLARRGIWIRIQPRPNPNASDVKSALMGIWTDVMRRKGVVWSSETGFNQLPEKNKMSRIAFHLTRKVDGIERALPVVVQIKRNN